MQVDVVGLRIQHVHYVFSVFILFFIQKEPPFRY